jgi:hypothetical protein
MNKPFAFAGRTWQWLQVGQCWELRTGGEPIARVVPDVLYPGMYRVGVLPCGVICAPAI